uniref:C2H2-type domain-containing protein n=2 Tax=Panagrolaimus sp. JU765 TaxID=591449 RepID=A0AC34R4R2_9BILA
MIPDGIKNFKVLLDIMYGQSHVSDYKNNENLILLAQLLQYPEMEEQLREPSNPMYFPIPAASNGSQLYNLYSNYFLQNQLSSLISGLPQAFLPLQTPLPNPKMADLLAAGTNRLSTPVETARVAPPSPDSENGDQLIVSNDKEGWCRNKKYIETVDKGYRCTVCRKVYGRYNSVSYHVTIYHRNPPIRCGVEGCPFTTREARYIHFHKYYRHGIKLPGSIDLASRKCPFCRHISKSPAMLEKHICRHVQDCLKSGNQYSCLKCTFETTDQDMVFDHLKLHQREAVEEEIALSKQGKKLSKLRCSYTTSESKQNCNLAAIHQHYLMQQSTEMLQQDQEAFATKSLAFQLALQQLFKNGFPIMTNPSMLASTISDPLSAAMKTMDLMDDETESRPPSLYQESSRPRGDSLSSESSSI